MPLGFAFGMGLDFSSGGLDWLLLLLKSLTVDGLLNLVVGQGFFLLERVVLSHLAVFHLVISYIFFHDVFHLYKMC